MLQNANPYIGKARMLETKVESGKRLWWYGNQWNTDAEMNQLMSEIERLAISSARKRAESVAKCHGTSRFLSRYPEHGVFDA